MILVIDTHALVWFLEGSKRLGPAARLALQSNDAEIVIPSIVLAEIFFLNQRRRIATSVSNVLEYISRSENCIVYPLDESVIERLPATLEIHDAIIAATALVFRDVVKKEVALVSKDSEIEQSNIVRLIW